MQLLHSGIHVPGNLRSDGKSIFIVSRKSVVRLEKKNGKWKKHHLFSTNKKYRYLALADADTHSGFAATGKIFALDEGKIIAFDINGKELGKVLTLPDLLNKCPYTTIAIMPDSGDLLAASYYPNLKFYRFKADGTEYKKDGWPIGGWVTGTTFFEGKVWGYFSMATAYPNSVVNRANLPAVGGQDLYITGIASDGKNGYYLNTSLGIKHYPAWNTSEAVSRIGGSGNVKALAMREGRILVSTGNQLYMLMLDDMPDSPLIGNGSEYWRVGKTWNSSSPWIASDKDGYLVYDCRQKKLWKFFPSKSRRERWVKQKGPLPEMNIKTSGGQTVGQNGQAVYRLLNGKKIWTVTHPGVRDVVIIGKYVAVVDGKNLSLRNLSDSKIVFSIPANLTHLAAEGRWLVGSAPDKAALIRYKLKEKN